MPEPGFLAVTGPTASGKTALSIALARALGGEIVSMDSRQVYRGMDVGTDKVGLADRARVPHHGLDVVDPDESYSAGRFARETRRLIQEIRWRGRIPMLVGGTGFFLQALCDPMFREPPLDAARLAALRGYLRRLPPEKLHAWVRVLDPARAALAAEGGRQRMARTLEVALLTGRPLSWWHARGEPEGPPLRGLVVLLELPRTELYRRIDARAQRMMEGGLEDEVRRLLRAGFGPEAPGMTGTGYREVAAYLRGEATREEALDRTRRATRAYARRQLTWFRHRLPAPVVRLDATRRVDGLVGAVVTAWRAAGGGSGHDLRGKGGDG